MSRVGKHGRLLRTLLLLARTSGYSSGGQEDLNAWKIRFYTSTDDDYHHYLFQHQENLRTSIVAKRKRHFNRTLSLFGRAIWDRHEWYTHSHQCDAAVESPSKPRSCFKTILTNNASSFYSTFSSHDFPTRSNASISTQSYQYITPLRTTHKIEASLDLCHFVSHLEYLDQYSSIHTTYRALKGREQARSLLAGNYFHWKPALPNLKFERDSIDKKKKRTVWLEFRWWQSVSILSVTTVLEKSAL